ncbi:hypothetical protein [Micromonospora vulcania]|uniref:Uncharacterized protein n=1 Tax=Micromonospora vulcania TaxID=1441873 RepID=A0ABW1HBI8_9ACTN
MTAPAMPEPGSRLSLRAGEWQMVPGTPAYTYHDIRVVSVHPSEDTAWSWVRGHGPECSWPSADCTAPWCWEVLVSVDALAAAAAGEQS